MSVSKLVSQKAEQLLKDGRVEPHPVPATVFRVDGENGIYTTVIGAGVRTCTCAHGQRAMAGRAGGSCSHIEAAITWTLAAADRDLGREDREIHRYETALRARQATEHRQAQALFRRLLS